jgi:putative colanic acid biosysnthesis UDP-glucose lipid carrier transferase
MKELAPRARLLGQADRGSPMNATEPAWVFTLRSLLHPVLAVVCLMACLAFWGASLHGPYFLIAVLALVASADLLDVVKPYRRPGWRASLRALQSIVLRWTLVVGFIWGLLHVSHLSFLFEFHVLASWALITPVAMWIGDSAARHLLMRQHNGEAGGRKAVIIGLTEPGLLLEDRLKRDRSLRMQVTGFFDDRHADRLPREGLDRVLGTQSELPEFVRRNDVNVAYVTLPMTRNSRLERLLDALRDSTVSVYFVPNLFAFETVQARFDVIGGMPVVAVCESPFFGASSIAKRLFDLLVAALLVLLFAPVLVFVAAGVRLSSPGPIVFKQRRYGLDGRQIVIYKFRSMTVTEDGHQQYQQVTRGDCRVTRFGAWIRRLSLDELPQLFNVLGGSLSMVGPRPHAIAVNEQYRKLIPGYMVRHKVKPGITGWAQVNGYRGGDDLESMRKRVEFDMDYLRHWSLALDLAIVLRTVTIVWQDKCAY